MSIFELGLEYLKQQHIVKQRIVELTPMLKNLHGDDLNQMRRRIISLYATAFSCKEVGQYLINYERKEPCEQDIL